MTIISLPFFALTAAVFLVYWIFPARLRWLVLLAGSVFFILANTGYSLPLLAVFVFEVLMTWLAAYRLDACKSERAKSLLTGAVILLLLAILIFFKDLVFFVDLFNGIAGLFHAAPLLENHSLPAPFGISYYTLILAGYLLDVRWGTVTEPQKNPLKLMAFTGYFPQLSSGPFSRWRDTSGAMFGEAKWDLRRVQFGLQRFLWGLFKKLVVAERLSVMVNTIYGAPEIYRGLMVAVGAILYVAQLYTDFSGCMDIVIGVSELLGIPLPENFRRPFSSVSLSEIWRRWHMTLGFWLKDYLLYPLLKAGWMTRLRSFLKRRLGRKASRDIPTYIGMLVTWFCVGFWHGGSWKYICASGLFFFAMIAGGMLLAPAFEKLTRLLRINTEAWSWKLFQRVRSFCLFAFSVSFGRRETLAAGFRAWKTVFTVRNPWVLVDGTLFNLGLERPDTDVCILGLAAVLIVSMLQEKHGSVRELLARQNLVFRWAVYLALFLAVYLFGRYGPGYVAADFIYNGF